MALKETFGPSRGLTRKRTVTIASYKNGRKNWPVDPADVADTDKFVAESNRAIDIDAILERCTARAERALREYGVELLDRAQCRGLPLSTDDFEFRNTHSKWILKIPCQRPPHIIPSEAPERAKRYTPELLEEWWQNTIDRATDVLNRVGDVRDSMTKGDLEQTAMWGFHLGMSFNLLLFSFLEPRGRTGLYLRNSPRKPNIRTMTLKSQIWPEAKRHYENLNSWSGVATKQDGKYGVGYERLRQLYRQWLREEIPGTATRHTS
jgi:hypothetical protein